MYRNYIIETFQNGGAKIEPIFAHGFSEQSIKRINMNDNFLTYDVSKVPMIDDGNLNSPVSKLYQGYIGERSCSLMIDVKTSERMINMINKDMENLKTKLKTYINLCVKIRQNEINKMKKVIEIDKPDKFIEYVSNMEQLIGNTKKKIVTLNKTFENNIRMLSKAYQNDKTGMYPIANEKLEIDDVMKKIRMNYVMNKSDSDKKNDELVNEFASNVAVESRETTKLTENEFTGIKGKYITTVIEPCQILNVNLRKEYIKIGYGDNKEATIYFKNFCIKDESSTTHTPPSKPTPPPPKPKTPALSTSQPPEKKEEKKD